MNEIIASLESLPKELLSIIILDLMQKGKIDFAEIAALHAEHLEELREGQSKKLQELVVKVIHLHCDSKKNRDKNLCEMMHYLLDEGRVNMTHEDIDRKYKLK